MRLAAPGHCVTRERERERAATSSSGASDDLGERKAIEVFSSEPRPCAPAARIGYHRGGGDDDYARRTAIAVFSAAACPRDEAEH